MHHEDEFWVVSERVLSAHGKEELGEQALCIHVRGAYIQQMLPPQSVEARVELDRARAQGVPVIDVGQNPVVPCWVNAHTHLAMAPLRGITNQTNGAGDVVKDVFFEIERHLSAADVRSFTRIGAYESLLLGVGEVWDHYYFGTSVAEGLLDAGLPGVVAPTLQDQSGPGSADYERQLLDTEALATERRFKEGGVRAAVGPHASDTVSLELLTRCADLARHLKIPLHLHFQQGLEERRHSEGRFGSSGAQELVEALDGVSTLMAHGLYLSERDCELLAGAGWVLAYCPLSQLQFGHLSPFASWLQSGGSWVLGTDCVASNDALDPQRELPLVAGDPILQLNGSIERGRLLSEGTLASGRALDEARQAALHNTKILGARELLGGVWGRPLASWTEGASGALDVGSVASFLVLSAHHPALFGSADLCRCLALGSLSGAIDWAVIRGRRRGAEGGLRVSILDSDEYRAALEEARRRRDELFVRAGVDVGAGG
jgi:hypothetical protein